MMVISCFSLLWDWEKNDKDGKIFLTLKQL